ncbi:protein fan [Stylonychia lemnae]|uniref:Protein fan n=1 Tax=Stylonychia lemnae TaxID=5949 RepID=A0A077ZYH9_STYLE|nr:protein fan [Stylonychia lemnae]|eukprot:CDW73591.1 protein fan [Stylonychia lemnae]
MLGIGKQSRKFNLLLLEEGEQYIKDFTGTVRFFDFVSEEYRSLIVEIENDSQQPILKYLFKFFAHEPQLFLNKLVEVPASNIVKPYKYHQVDQAQKEYYELQINIQFQSVETLYKSIFKLYELFKTKNSFHYEQDLDKMFFQNSEFFSNSSFDKTRIKSISEKTVLHKEFKVKQVIPMVQIEGLLYLTDKRIYFQPCHSIYKILTNKNKSLYVIFSNVEERDVFYQALRKMVSDSCVTTERSVLDYTQQWVNGGMSNQQYLLLLNSYAQRSFQDITQYPVFPWIIKDYKSDILDLNDINIYRDLSKPIGALNEKRLKEFIIRYNECPEGEKYLYGTHYSCPGYVIGFLVRQHPQWMIKFQGGKYDNPNRLFKGINKEWDSVNTNPGNVKELIPEFFMDNPDFLVNKQKLDFGVRSNGKRVDNAKLPSWAHSADDFLKKNRAALESDYVSNNIHLWIDLIFGCKQKSIDDFNVFHPLTYEGHVDFEKLQDPVQRLAYEVQITEFGQTPRQLFRLPHPQKYSKVIPKSLCATLESIQSTANAVMKDHEEQKLEDKFKQILEDETRESASETSFQTNKNSQKEDSKKQESIQTSDTKSSAFKDLSNFKFQTYDKVHKDVITSMHLINDDESNNQKLVTTSMDGFIKMIDVRDGQTKKAFFVCQSGINTATSLSSQDSFADKLISCSSDQTLRIWDLKGSNFSSPTILYDHEEEIVSASVHQNLLASMDLEGTIIVRDMRNLEVITNIRQSKQYESGQVLFNTQMKNEIIVFFNNELEMYDTDGRLIQSKELDFNVTHAAQDQDSVVLTYDNGTLAVYDWNSDKLVDEKEDIANIKSLAISSDKVPQNEKMLAIGGDKGDLTLLRQK